DIPTTRGELRLSAPYGHADDPITPRRGLIFRPLLGVAGPAPGSVRYATAGLNATALVPFGPRAGVVGRVGGGAVFPFAGTDPDLFLEDFFGTRDALFFGGGTGDVRGWAGNQLGPKFLDLRQDSARAVELRDLILTTPPGAARDSLVDLFYREGLFVRRAYLPIGGR